MNRSKSPDIRMMAVLAMLCGLSYISVLVFSPIKVQFLSFEIKDAILAIGAFLYGPWAALLSVVLVAFLELVTISQTGWIGLLMNVLSSAFFLCPAAMFYRRDRSLRGAVIGLVSGTILTTAAMVMWNWLITPLYMEVPRAAVEQLLIPLFLPFNALKATINAVLTVLLYKSVVTALRKARLFPEATVPPVRRKPYFLVVAAVLLVVLTTVLLVWSGII